MRRITVVIVIRRKINSFIYFQENIIKSPKSYNMRQLKNGFNINVSLYLGIKIIIMEERKGR